MFINDYSTSTMGVFRINDIDYARYVKAKTGLSWSRENTNDEDAGRDAGLTMHPNVTSHQRKLDVRLGPMPFAVAQQLEADLEANDSGIRVTYPDLMDGVVTRLFYNTSIKSAIEQFTPDGVMIDDIQFSLISVKEDTV